MTLPELSIKRHVLAYMLSGVLVLFGIISYQRLGIDRFPSIEFPIISITTTQLGANPEIVDASITNIIEKQLNSVPGIEHIQSSSSPGVSTVAITFDLDKNIDVAFNEVQAKINQVLRLLPKDADPPVVAKVETNAQPIMWLALQGDRTQQQLNLYAQNIIKKKLETISGVGEVRLGGKRDRTIRVNLDPARMAAFGVTAKDLTDAFHNEHLQLPGGFLVGEKTEALLKLDLEFHQTDALQNLIVVYRDGAPVRLKDVASIEDGLADYRQLARFNGKPAIGLGIVKIANTNTVAIVGEVKKRLDEEIIPQLPPGMTIKVASNDALFIQQMVDALKQHLIEGTLLAALVVLIFLKSWRSTLIVSAAIPVSLLGAIAVMYFAGFTFNTLTLLALLLLIGVVVDDAIVVLENIYRHREKIDPDPETSAINGSREVVFAVLAATLSLVAIFAPVLFMGGIIGKFFKSFAVVVTFGVLVSMFVSLTLTPMLCSRYLTVSKEHGPIYRWLENMFNKLDHFYRHLLNFALNHRWKVVVATILVVLSSGYFFANVGKTFVPDEDEGRFLVFFKTPLGSGINYTDDRLKNVQKVLAGHKEIATYFTAIGLGQAGQVNQGIAFVRMVPPEERNIKQYELLSVLRKELAGIPGVRAFAAPVAIVGGQRGEPLQFVVRGPNLEQVSKMSQQLLQKLQSDPGLGRLDLDLQLDLPQLVMNIDRTRSASLGLSAKDIADAVNMISGGINVAKYNDQPGDGERYDIRLKAGEGTFTQPSDLSRIYLRSRDGQLVRLDTVASFKETIGAAVIGKLDLQYGANFYATPTVPLGDAVTRIKQVAAEIMPAGYTVKFVGQAEEFSKTINYMAFAFVLALILLYMVLASQFNSFVQPMIIMVAQPLAIIGGVMGLWLMGNVFAIQSMTLNIYSMIGLVLLIGLVAKNSILLVDLTNQRREGGMGIDAALKDACPIRMRPVLMTSLTVILALLPAATGLGAGAETNGPLAVAVIGGMISSTLLTLMVVPSVYSLVENGIAKWKAR
ncbi:efflux RND transporter permease subunit [Sulfurirhabdus autotrophica]|uniref:HAE1 family hydrophobic/amphiphilic exporter-1 n=1 Tax=Sulfurirhabdus autotrophica TaxID=1706046 RepID=A0A4V2W223_9PROT|nr:efflux RND transporter permease subunit [Sulfurirhabdus autotrophica]TCV86399.1 HAE1 family hydrophobic/amphiphilic exporter-1 [Sulfurirhabdus autotrophica]